LVLRIFNEESVLTKELPGYKEYCDKMKYRLIAFIWQRKQTICAEKRSAIR